MAKQFKLQFDMENAAFEFQEEEIGRILRLVEHHVLNGHFSRQILDGNGNGIGDWSISE